MRGIDAHAHMSRSFEVGAARMMTNLRIEICHPRSRRVECGVTNEQNPIDTTTVEVHGLLPLETRQWDYHYSKRHDRCELYEESHIFYSPALRVTVCRRYCRALL